MVAYITKQISVKKTISKFFLGLMFKISTQRKLDDFNEYNFYSSLPNIVCSSILDT